MSSKDVRFFNVTQDKSCLEALKHWLKSHRYNSWSYANKDKNGNEIIPIRWDRKPDSDWGRPEPVTGIIVIKDPSLRDEVLEIVEQQSK